MADKMLIVPQAEHDELEAKDFATFEAAGFVVERASDAHIVTKRVLLTGTAADRYITAEATHPSNPSPPESILVEAERIVNGPRQATYGHPLDNFTRLAKLCEPIVGVPLTAEQMALIMVQVKVSRLCETPGHRDSQVDGAGYFGVYSKIGPERARRAEAKS